MSDRLELSVVMIAGAQRARAQQTIEAVGAQTAHHSIELVVVDVASEDDPLRLPGSIRSQRVNAPQGTPWGTLRANGVRAAAAPVVAFIEDHCAPQPGWAEALIETHREPWAAVGYAFVPANPTRWRSRATLIAEYGFWAHPVKGGLATILPGNNISYKRELLLSLGDDLDRALDVDDNLHRRFAAQGLESGVSARACVAHQELAGIRPTAKANYDYGRMLAAARSSAEKWGLSRRLLYAAAVPLGAPAARALRLVESLRGRPALWGQALAAVPAIAAIWLANALGQAAGCLFGTGDAGRRLVGWELSAEREQPAPTLAPRHKAV
jgi:glycosyl transferase family 2